MLRFGKSIFINTFRKTRLLSSELKMPIKYLSQEQAVALDQELFQIYSIEQLIELAGLSVAQSISRAFKATLVSTDQARRVLVVCGPGNNGADGLVAARHLKCFGTDTSIYYPKRTKSDLYAHLVRQCEMFDIPFLAELDEKKVCDYDLVVDALFGFSFKAPIRPEYEPLMSTLKAYRQKPNSKLVSVDIPSGWDVNEGYDPQSNALMPDCLISLTAPKLCAQHLESNLQHWICNHFVPKTLKDKYGLTAPVKSGEITWQLNETIA